MTQRIVSLLASATEILYGIGLGDHVVAISHECDHPREVASKPRVTRTTISIEASSGDIDRQVRELTASCRPIYEINVDQLAALRPDLIVTQAHCDVCAVSYEHVLAAVRDVAVLRDTRVVALNPTTLEGVLADIQRVGDAAGCPARAREYVESLRGRIEAIRARTSKLEAEHRPRVVCIEWIDPVMVAANWMPDLIEIAGGRSPLTKSGDRSAYTHWEDVTAFDPEVIVVMPCGFDLARATAEAAVLPDLPGWSDISAVRNRRVFAVDGNAYFNRSGPRLVDSVEILAELIHPQWFDRSVTAREHVAATLK